MIEATIYMAWFRSLEGGFTAFGPILESDLFRMAETVKFRRFGLNVIFY